MTQQYSKDYPLNLGGRPQEFESPQDFWNRSVEYINNVLNTPLYKSEQIKMPGKEWQDDEGNIHKPERVLNLPVAQAMTWEDLAVHLKVTSRTLRNYQTDEKHKEFFPIFSHVDDIMYAHNFKYSAAGLMNANLIARKLGLTDKKDYSVTMPEYNGLFKGVRRPEKPTDNVTMPDA